MASNKDNFIDAKWKVLGCLLRINRFNLRFCELTDGEARNSLAGLKCLKVLPN